MTLLAVVLFGTAARTARADDDMPNMPMPEHAAHHGAAGGLFGPYGMTRDASGTSWQPDSTPMDGVHLMRGDWMVMTHGYADAVYDRQGGPRGGAKGFSESMLMSMAQRPLAGGTLGLRAMASLDPAMGRSGRIHGERAQPGRDLRFCASLACPFRRGRRRQRLCPARLAAVRVRPDAGLLHAVPAGQARLTL